MLRVLAKRASRLFFVPVKSKRTLPPEQLLTVASGTVCDSLADALDQTKDEAEVIVTGSLFLVGEAMELIGISPAPPKDERILNER